MRQIQTRNHKVTSAQAREIRSKASRGVLGKDLAAEYGLNVSTVYSIVNGRIHASRVTATISDEVFLALETHAFAAKMGVEELAAKMLAKGVGY